ncbi:MAG: glycosyltransferase family 2 protein [Ignavibacteria bacterium]|nr:glycosyltransferase family 2 protein [Ignavibacteria bacterium]
MIVPTYNRLPLLRQTLESLFRQDFRDYEIIVVNDGSCDGTDAYLKTLSAESRIIYHCQENQGLAATRNAGLRYAHGEYIAFTDDDCVLPKDWLSKYHGRFRQSPAVGIGGASRTGNPTNPYAEANDLINNYLKTALNSDRVEAPFLTGNNVAYTRAILEKVGGPDNRFRMGAEDRDLTYRIVRAGGVVLFDPSIVVDHYNDADLIGFVRHQYDQGKGSYLFYRLNRNSFGRPSSIPMAVYLGLLVHPFTVQRLGKAALLFFLIVLAQIAVVAGFLTAMISHNRDDSTGNVDEKKE